MIYGYVRISTAKQNIERQIRNIVAVYPAAVIIKEVYTGTKFQGRKEFDKLLGILKPGDTIVFDSVSRMSRNSEEGCQLYEQLFNNGITLVFLKEPHINTETFRAALNAQIQITLDTGNAAADNFINGIIDALNRFTIDLAQEQVRIAFDQSEKEVEDLHQRTREGMLTAKMNGKQIGQPQGAKYTVKKEASAKAIIKKYSRDFDGTLDDTAVIKIAGVSRNTFYKYKRELRVGE